VRMQINFLILLIKLIKSIMGTCDVESYFNSIDPKINSAGV